jgi:hypothetical protein
MQSENHGSGEHDATLEPDADIKAGPVFAWGIAMFGAVIVSIVLLTGYFWMHQREAMTAKQGEASKYGDTLKTLRASEKAALEKGAMPIEKAMESIVREGL